MANIITCNELFRLNDYIVNRPERFHYHFRFGYPSTEDIRQYLLDKLKPEYYGEIENVVTFSKKISLNYDCLRSIAFELNMGESFSDAIADLNILNTDEEAYNLELLFENGEKLHRWRYETNLFNHYHDECYASMCNAAEHYVVDIRFNKRNVTFDPVKYSVIVPGECIELDYSDYKDNEESEHFEKSRPLYMTLVRAPEKMLHYTV